MRRLPILLLCAASAAAQQNQVRWSAEVEPAKAPPGATVLLKLKGAIEPGWHLYSMTTAAAIPTKVQLTPAEAVQSFRVLQPKPKRAYDPNFQLDTETYEKQVVFLIETALKQDAAAGEVELTASVRYQVCNDTMCIPPVTRTAAAMLTIDPRAPRAAAAIPAGYAEPGSIPASGPDAGSTQGLAAFLLVAFGLGLAAIFTPCVFPMIPITMSYFLNRPSGSRGESLTQAGVFCLGIVVLFTALGLIATAALGPFGVVQIGSNPWVNGFIALVFLVFGLSLLGAFEITIPSALVTKLDSASRRGGIAGTLLMGLTFALTSFACVGPFMGTLLAASIQGGKMRPAVGMMTFASGLALPFFLLAVFPSYLKRLPRSGGWLARVKVVLGFVVLAAMFKYISSIDQVLQWNLLTRERFLAAWIVLFALAGLYLLGFVRLEGVKPEDRMGIGRLLAGAAFLIFSLSLLPGMFGQRLGELDAYVPLAAGGDGQAEAGGLAWTKNDLDGALKRARAEGKLVFVSFTGYACTNCHWMKANMFTRPEIQAALGTFILVELYTDGTDAASEVNQRLQETRFATVAIPYYAILDAGGAVVASFPGLTRNAPQFLSFLEKKPAAQPSAVSSAGSAIAASFDPASLQGKIGVVNFWATWCVPCIQEIPSFNRIHEELGGQGVAIVGVSMDEEGPAIVEKFLQEHPMKYAVAMGEESFNEKYRLTQLPVTVIYDRAGKQVQRFEGYTKHEALDRAIRSLL
jgi:thiol:disulfide interchange protein DsbD